MTHKERIMAAINHKKPDRVPYDVWFTPEVIDVLYKHLEAKGLDTRVPDFLTRKEYLPVLMGTDFITIEYGPVTGFYMSDEPEYTDEWGIKWKWVENGVGGRYTEMDVRPLTGIEDVSEFEIPDFKNPERYHRIRKCIEVFGKEYAVVGALTCTLFELSWFLRGMDNVMCGMMVNKDFMHAYLDKLMNWALDAGKNLVDLGVDIIFFGDDFGGQDSMLISPELFREFFKPRYAKLISILKSMNHELKIAFHCDGYFYPILKDLVEVGIDILNPIQPKSMDPLKIKKEFGNSITLWGTVDNQEVMPFGSVDDVIKETKTRIETLSEGGGLILGPAHGVQPNTTLEKILSFYQTAEKYGRML